MTQTEIEQDSAELSAIATRFAVLVPGHDRDVEAFANELTACRDRQIQALFAQRFRTMGLDVRLPRAQRVERDARGLITRVVEESA